jgi:CRP-like cAMP-binding protein
MVSTEVLRRYPFFAFLNDSQLRAIAMITNEETFEQGAVLFNEKKPAAFLYVLMDGGVDLYYTVEEPNRPDLKKEFSVGEINPGEMFAVSALVEPYIYTSTAKAAKAGRMLKIDGQALRALCELQPQMGYPLMTKLAKSIMERLVATRVQLAAAWA